MKTLAAALLLATSAHAALLGEYTAETLPRNAVVINGTDEDAAQLLTWRQCPAPWAETMGELSGSCGAAELTRAEVAAIVEEVQKYVETSEYLATANGETYTDEHRLQDTLVYSGQLVRNQLAKAREDGDAVCRQHAWAHEQVLEALGIEAYFEACSTGILSSHAYLEVVSDAGTYVVDAYNLNTIILLEDD